MIGSFWNLCRACPSMPVDKLHSEYRSTYRWHEYTGGPEVIRRPPVPNQFGSVNEPPLPRRKKCPELAYRKHEFISCDEPDKSSSNINNRARSEERGSTPSRRSKSEGPPGANDRNILPIPNGIAVNINGGEESIKKTSGQAGESSGLFKKTISKLSTEYRLQFVWPHVRKAIQSGTDDMIEPPRKSLSMGAIKSSHPNINIPMVHKKRTTNTKEAAVHELEPLVKDNEDSKLHERKHYEKYISDTERYGFISGKKMSEQDMQRKQVKENIHMLEHFAFDNEEENEPHERKHYAKLITDTERYGFSSDKMPAKQQYHSQKRQHRPYYRIQNNDGFGLPCNNDIPDPVERKHFEKFVSDTERYGFGDRVKPTEKEIQKHRQQAYERHANETEHFALDFAAENQQHERKHYDKFLSDTKRYGFSSEKNQQQSEIDGQQKLIPNGHIPSNETWYKEVIELRKKAVEYKSRGWGIEIDPDLHKKQKELWEQVSRRSSLSALSLASTVRPITKEEKDKENNKKTSPTKGVSRYPGQPLPIGSSDSKKRNIVRHHLERTTGPEAEEGAILPSPTREKLMPTIPKSKEDDSYNSQRGSPKKSATSRHSSPQKGSPQKGSPKKMTKGRSQSVGPGQNESSPKRQIRTTSSNTTNNSNLSNNNTSTTNTTATPLPANKTHKKTPVSTPTGERRPRPTTLSTTARTRSKSSSLPPNNARAHSAPNQNHLNQNSLNDQNKSSPSTINIPNLRKTNKSNNNIKQQQRPKSTVITSGGSMIDSTNKIDEHRTIRDGLDKKMLMAENEDDLIEKEGGTSISSASPLPPQEITEHIVKSPPEPTRVKSPEQILMRSPDPVNWTVPLDTGKTFTVTQNVRDGGDPVNRPQSEFKASTPVDKPPPAPQSAPPELAEQAKMEAWKNEQKPNNDIETSTTSSSSITPNIINPPEVRFDKPVPGSTLRCLEDPIFDPEINSPSSSRNPTTTTTPGSTDVLEKARNRFDRFWGGGGGGGNNPEKDEENV